MYSLAAGHSLCTIKAFAEAPATSAKSRRWVRVMTLRTLAFARSEKAALAPKPIQRCDN